MMLGRGARLDCVWALGGNRLSAISATVAADFMRSLSFQGGTANIATHGDFRIRDNCPYRSTSVRTPSTAAPPGVFIDTSSLYRPAR